MFNIKKIVTLLVFSQWMYYFSQAADFHSPRTAALGGAGHASPLLTDAIYLNPSFSSFMFTHGLSINYLMYQYTLPIINEQKGNNLNLSILDGTTETLFQAGAGYTRNKDIDMVHIGASKSFTSRFGFGLGLKIFFPHTNQTTGSQKRTTDSIFSATGFISDEIQTAIIIDNLFETSSEKGFYRDFILGIKFNISKIVLIYVDPHWMPSLPKNIRNWGYQIGLEFPFLESIFLRGGLFKNSFVPHQRSYSDGKGLGIGWVMPHLSIEYAFSETQTQTQPQSKTHYIGSTLHF